jgi:hypothetical protein
MYKRSLYIMLSILMGIFFVGSTEAATITLDGNSLVYQADPGETNLLTLSVHKDEWSFEELAVNISTALPECVGDGSKFVVCDISVSSIKINLDDEDDKLWIDSNNEDVYIDMGSGDDEITWKFDDSEEDGFIEGGTGNNTVKILGSSLNDEIIIDESGGRVRIINTNSFGSVRLDIEEVEIFEIYGEDGDDHIIFTEDVEDINNIDDMRFRIYGGEGNDILDAGAIPKALFAFEYALELYGNEGADYLIGSAGKDILDCGDGIDRYKDNGGPDQVDDNCKNLQVTQAFSDVAGHTFLYYISDLYYNEVVSGYSDGKFHPERHVTRGQMAKFIVNGFSLNIKTNCDAFPDVSQDNDFYRYIQTLKCNNIVSGYSDGSYRPEGNVTRGEVTKFVVESIKHKGIQVGMINSSFPDVKSTNNFSGYIGYLTSLEVNDEKIISGYSDGTYRPDVLLDRGQMSKIVSNSRAFVGGR